MDPRMLKVILDKLLNPDFQKSGKTFTEEQVAVIINFVAAITADPNPGAMSDMYQTIMKVMSLPQGLEQHMLVQIMSCREALKETLIIDRALSSAMKSAEGGESPDDYLMKQLEELTKKDDE